MKMSLLNWSCFCIAIMHVMWSSSRPFSASQTTTQKLTPQFRPLHSLALNFYDKSCPKAHDIIKSQVIDVIKQNPSQAAGFMRIMFHDCFVQGCDASILLTESVVSEQIATPNNASLRASTIRIIDQIKDQVEAACPGVVSCADIIILATAISLELVGGPSIPMLMGRRDSLTAASNQTVIANIPAPQLNISALKSNFANHGLDSKDLVALSGGHTFGQAHCRVVDFQLTPTISTDLNPAFATNLSRICLPANPPAKSGLTVHLDFITKDIFDNNYYQNVLNKVAIFHSDAALLDAADTKALVQLYAQDQSKFFEQFKISMQKLSQIGTLTGNQGIIRKKCLMPS